MRAPAILTITLVAGAALAGCSSSATPSATPTPTSTPTPSAPPSASPTASNLPTVEAMLDALDTAAEDDRAPDIRLGVALTAGQPQFLEDARVEPLGQGAVRVACSNTDGSDVTVELIIGDAAPVTFEAPCIAAPSTVTSQPEVFDFSTTYRFTVTSKTDATVAIGVVRSVPQ